MILVLIFFFLKFSARLILDDWPFGSDLCKMAPFIQVASVYVSTISMAIIALDRYQALLYPLKTRLSHKIRKSLIILLIWFVASLLAIPHAIFNRSVELFTYKTVIRCRAVYPEPKDIYKKSITSFTILTQYVLPLAITMFTYVIICIEIYRKKFIGEADEQQISSQIKTKRKTIKMLIIVVIAFAICWLPINLFHLLNDFDLTEISLNAFYFVHWLAMSSVCYNPFIYFWLNKYYRKGIKSLFCCRIFKKSSKHRSNKSMLSLKRKKSNIKSNLLLNIRNECRDENIRSENFETNNESNNLDLIHTITTECYESNL